MVKQMDDKKYKRVLTTITSWMEEMNTEQFVNLIKVFCMDVSYDKKMAQKKQVARDKATCKTDNECPIGTNFDT